MRMLAIDTAGSACSVALFDGMDIIDSAHSDVGRGHAERLLPMIATLAGGGRADTICVDIGPGSFTGIRVGVAAARALAFGWGATVRGYHSLALLAAIDGASPDTTVAIEGGHGALFTGRYAGDLSVVEGPRSLPVAEAVAALTTSRIIGNAAERTTQLRGWGTSAAADLNAAGVVLLPDHAFNAHVTPFYGRAADAQPMAARA